MLLDRKICMLVILFLTFIGDQAVYDIVESCSRVLYNLFSRRPNNVSYTENNLLQHV